MNCAYKKVISYILVLTMFCSMATAFTSVNVLAGSSETLVSNKTTYAQGEDIIVTAAGGAAGANKAWVGIYKKGNTPGGGSTSIYWYYLNNSTTNSMANKPVVLQSQKYESGDLSGGEYEIHLFYDSGYTILKTIEITIEGDEEEDNTPIEGNLVSVEYKLDSKTDGFANGDVVITADSSKVKGADCIMYWADNEGKPLDDYTPLAKFRLTGETTVHEMYDYTIIPEGAETLIASMYVSGEQTGDSVMTDLPEDCNYILDDNYNVEFQLISDTHVRAEKNHIHNTHFNQMLDDVKANSPESIGIFINGDVTDNGQQAQFEKLVSLYNEAKSTGRLPELHLAIGNHDWMNGNPENQFQKYAKLLNGNLSEQPENIYYNEVVEGYNFIYLGGESAGGNANLSAAQLTWFDNLMKEITAEDPEKPVFVLLHQPLYDTVAGSLSGQGWHGVNNEQNLRDVLKKYDQIIIAGGHSHWEFDSERNMYPGDDNMSVAVNTASVGYLWSSYNIIGGEHADGSNGYFVRVYDDKVVFLGRDIENSKYVSSAMFVVEKNHINTASDNYEIDIKDDKVKLDADIADDNNVSFESSDESVVKVSSLGTLRPVKEGSAVITIKAGATERYVKNYKTVNVTVTDKPVADEPEIDDPEINDPEIDDPEINDPEIDDPEINDPEINDPETNDPEEHKHIMGEWFEVTAADCENDGKLERKCETCEYTETESIPSTGHTVAIDKSVPATCTQTGLTEGKHCSICGKILTVQNTVPMKDHDYVYLDPVAPTCTETGLSAGIWCERCGTINVKQEIIAATGHEYSDWIIEKHAACTNAGTEIKVCNLCENTLRQAISATGHKYEFFTKTDEPASTIEAGKAGTYRYCIKCEDKTDAKLMMTSAIRKISDINISKDKFIYNGKNLMPEITVKNSVGTKLVQGLDYDISIMNSSGNTVSKSVAVGTYQVVVSFKGNYGGAEELCYKIMPKGTNIRTIVSGKKKATVKWYKKTAQVTGYQIRYSTKKNMNNAKNILITKPGTTSRVIKNLKSKKKYYVQIRTYKTVNSVKYYSEWSAKKTIKIK